jgi:uncharacterized protein YcfL
MRRLAIIAPCALALLALAGCQSEEEKRAEREKLKSELRNEILSELRADVPGIVRDEFRLAVDQHKREQADLRAKAQAQAKPAAPAKPAPKKK